MIPDMKADFKLSPIVTKLFLRHKKLNILLDFIWQSYFKVLKTISQIVTHYFITKTPDRRGLHPIISLILSLKILLNFSKTTRKNNVHF